MGKYISVKYTTIGYHTHTKSFEIITKSRYRKNTNILFLKMQVLKFVDLVKFRTAQISYEARNNQLPLGIQELLIEREGKCNFRVNLNCKIKSTKTTRRSFGVSVRGAKLWNGLPDKIKRSGTIKHFKD